VVWISASAMRSGPDYVVFLMDSSLETVARGILRDLNQGKSRRMMPEKTKAPQSLSLSRITRLTVNMIFKKSMREMNKAPSSWISFRRTGLSCPFHSLPRDDCGWFRPGEAGEGACVDYFAEELPLTGRTRDRCGGDHLCRKVAPLYHISREYFRYAARQEKRLTRGQKGGFSPSPALAAISKIL
jgi:hypothetical protein